VIPEILNHSLFPLLAIIATLFLLLLINRKRLVTALLNLKTQRCLKHLGIKQISAVQCPDGLGGEFAIDRVVLHPEGVSIVTVKRYPGKIFCADGIDEWTQMLGNKSFKFPNPLYELDLQVKSLESCLPGVSVDGFLFFDHQAEFPKGSPQRVFQPVAVPDKLLPDRSQPLDPELEKAWDRLNQFRSQ
jgi:hypothetical protein